MKIYEPLVLLLGILAQVLGTRITLDDEAQALCKKYKMMCKTGKVCAVQHFEVPKRITMPVCIPLEFVPVRNLICQLPPDPGRCFARYIRWYYNIHSRECTHFRYGGCHGNQNNFMSKEACKESCLATPSINLFEGGQSALVQMKPSIMTAPVYEPAKTNSYEALSSVNFSGKDNNYDRYRVARHRTNKNKSDEGNTRKRRRLEKEKERRRRERRKEKKRLKRLRKKQRNLKRSKKPKKNKKKKRDRIEEIVETDHENKDTTNEEGTDVTNVVKDVADNVIEPTETDTTPEENTEKKKKRKRKKRRNKDRKKRDRYRTRRHPSYSNRRYAELRAPKAAMSYKMFSILDQDKTDSTYQKNSILETTS